MLRGRSTVAVVAIRQFAASDPVAKVMFEHFAKRANDSAETTVKRLAHELPDIKPRAITAFFKKLDSLGCGKYFVGRKGRKSRFRWFRKSIDVGKLALGQIEKAGRYDPLEVSESVPIREDDEGVWRIGNTRVLFALVIREYQRGATPEAIADNYSTVELAHVYSAVAYYLRNREEVDSYLARREKVADELRRQIEKRQPETAEIRARLLAARASWRL